MAILLNPSIHWGLGAIVRLGQFAIYLILTQEFLCHELIITSTFCNHVEETPEKIKRWLLQKLATAISSLSTLTNHNKAEPFLSSHPLPTVYPTTENRS